MTAAGPDGRAPRRLPDAHCGDLPRPGPRPAGDSAASDSASASAARPPPLLGRSQGEAASPVTGRLTSQTSTVRHFASWCEFSALAGLQIHDAGRRRLCDVRRAADRGLAAFQKPWHLAVRSVCERRIVCGAAPCVTLPLKRQSKVT